MPNAKLKHACIEQDDLHEKRKVEEDQQEIRTQQDVTPTS